MRISEEEPRFHYFMILLINNSNLPKLLLLLLLPLLELAIHGPHSKVLGAALAGVSVSFCLSFYLSIST